MCLLLVPVQPEAIYFSVLFEVGIFMVVSDTTGKQYNYMIPASDEVPKGSKAVVGRSASVLSTIS